VRQQWVFSSPGANIEIDDSFLDLREVTVQGLEANQPRHDKQVFASLQSIQIG
jgi:hypothetical protein